MLDSYSSCRLDNMEWNPFWRYHLSRFPLIPHTQVCLICSLAFHLSYMTGATSILAHFANYTMVFRHCSCRPSASCQHDTIVVLSSLRRNQLTVRREFCVLASRTTIPNSVWGPLASLPDAQRTSTLTSSELQTVLFWETSAWQLSHLRLIWTLQSRTTTVRRISSGITSLVWIFLPRCRDLQCYRLFRLSSKKTDEFKIRPQSSLMVSIDGIR